MAVIVTTVQVSIVEVTYVVRVDVILEIHYLVVVQQVEVNDAYTVYNKVVVREQENALNCEEIVHIN